MMVGWQERFLQQAHECVRLDLAKSFLTIVRHVVVHKGPPGCRVIRWCMHDARTQYGILQWPCRRGRNRAGPVQVPSDSYVRRDALLQFMLCQLSERDHGVYDW